MKRFLLACLLLAASLPAFAQTAWSIVPTGNDYVTMGVARTYNTANAQFYINKSTPDEIVTSVVGNDMGVFELTLKAPEGEILQPGEYFFAERAPFKLGRAPGLEFYGNGHGCNVVYGHFAIRQIQFDATGQLRRLEASIVHYCDGYPPAAVAVLFNAPALHFAISAPDFARINRSYYGETTTFSLVHSATDKFQYKSSGLRDVWTMNFAAPTGQTQFAKGIYLTEGVAKPGVAGMDIGLGQNRKGEYGKLDVLTITYRNGAVVQLSARFYFYSDAARTKLIRSGRINFWK